MGEVGWVRESGAGPCPITCWYSLEEVQVLVYQVGEEPETQALMETCFQQHEEPPTAPGKQHTGGRWGHRDIKDMGHGDKPWECCNLPGGSSSRHHPNGSCGESIPTSDGIQHLPSNIRS